MSERRYRTMQALILGGTGLFLLDKIWTGTLFLYINTHFLILVLLAAVMLLVLAQRVFAELRRNELPGKHTEIQPRPERRDRWTLLLLALPLLLGVLIPTHSHGSGSSEAVGGQTLAASTMISHIVPGWIPRSAPLPTGDKFTREAAPELQQTPPVASLDADIHKAASSTRTCSYQDVFLFVQNASPPALLSARLHSVVIILHPD